jgi:hypothetical protein
VPARLLVGFERRGLHQAAPRQQRDKARHADFRAFLQHPFELVALQKGLVERQAQARFAFRRRAVAHRTDELGRNGRFQHYHILPAAIVQHDDLVTGPQTQHARDLVGLRVCKQHARALNLIGFNKKSVHLL